ncbi:mitochondrial inner membrane protein-domain-containing protein [Dichotomocladium elegans]|nr:mitochondrial inner membrane protein-domain-containing protein [Dichotomocladium elegans]
MLKGAPALARAGTRAIQGSHLSNVSRHYATEATATPKKGSFRKKFLWTTSFATTLYAGATYAALHNEAFYDTYTTYVPGGEKLLDFLDDTLNDADIKGNLEKAAQITNSVAAAASQAKAYGVIAKDKALDIYEYASDAYSQLVGEKEPPAVPGSPQPRSSRKISKRGLFANVIETDETASVPTFKTIGEPALDELAKTLGELVTMLNDAGLKGHAKRLADYGSREIDLLYREYRKIQDEEARSLKEISGLLDKSSSLAQNVTQHCNEIEAKIKSVRQKSHDRVVEKDAKMKREFAAEAAQLQKEYNSLAQESLSNQRNEYMAALTSELKERAVEIQRQFIREVRQQVENERGGKLARVDEVSVRQRVLEQASYQNVEDLDDSRKAHQLVLAVDALKRAAYAGNQQAFLDELQVLLNISAPTSPFADIIERRNDELIQTIASSISESVARHGIDSMAQLVERFAKVSAEVRHASLIPEEGSSMISHIISIIMSKLMFRKQGLVAGDDLESRLARVEYYLEKEKDLESAAREMNQLTGWPKHLASDWLDAARRNLEVKQALEIMRTQALLDSILQL